MKTLTTAILVCTAFMLVLATASKAMSSISISEKGQICGRIVDITTGNPLEAASVELYTAGGKKLVVGTLTNNKGVYTFTMIEPGEYYLEISMQGYSSFKIKNINIKKDGGKTEVSETQLSKVSKKNARMIAKNKLQTKEQELAINNY